MPSKLLKVRETVAALRAALLVPSAEGLDAQIPELHLAAQTLECLHCQVITPESARDLADLSRDLRLCSRLIAQGLAITQGVARLLIPPSASYQPGGEPVLVPSGSTLVVRG